MTESDSSASPSTTRGPHTGGHGQTPPAPSRRRLLAAVDADCVRPRDRRDHPAVPPRPRAAGRHAPWHGSRWGLGLAGWALFVLAVYLTLGSTSTATSASPACMVGFLVGLTGMGGGALMTPVLDLRLRLRADDGRSAPTSPTPPSPRSPAPGSTGARARWTSPWRSGSRSAASRPPSPAWPPIAYVKSNYGDRAHQRGALQGHRLRADDGRRAAHREGRHARRRRAPPREHQDVAQAQGDDRRASASAPASSSASPRSAAARCSPCS